MDQIRKRNFISKAWIKFMRFLVTYFPANSVRVWALRQCGFKVGNDVYIASGMMLSTMNSDNSCQLVIEDRVSIGPRVTLVLAADPNNSKLIEYFPPVRGSITIRNDAWLGAGVILLPNVTIAEFSVVAAGAVVNKNTDPYTVVGGVPAVKIKDIDRK